MEKFVSNGLKLQHDDMPHNLGVVAECRSIHCLIGPKDPPSSCYYEITDYLI